MDSTPTQPHLTSSASKLPIKRKTPDSYPKGEDDVTPMAAAGAADHGPPPPFKFHRIWTEPDEIRFLQGLLDCHSQGLAFPRDLHIFYSRFSGSMSQPYTKSQLSEKLRRLRRKFRVISTRLAAKGKGLDKPLLSPHDRALYDLCNRLWHPDFASTSPFGAASAGPFNNNNNKIYNSNNNNHNNNNYHKPKNLNLDLVGVKVRFSPVLPSASALVFNKSNVDDMNASGGVNCVENGNDDNNSEVRLRDVNVEFEDGVEEEEEENVTLSIGSDDSVVVGRIVAKTVVDSFNRCLNEVKMAVDGVANNGLTLEEFQKRWQQQRMAELDVFARRLRLVLQQSLVRQ